MTSLFARLSTAAAFAFIAAIPALAADKAGIAPAPAAAPAEMVRDVAPFQGLYVGALLGHSAGLTNDAEGFKIPREGYTATGLLGYNHRLPGLVVGLEGDLGVTDISGSTNAGGFTVSGSNKVNGSLRARIGLPIGHTLVYGTGGFAMTNAKLAVETIGSQEKNTKGYVLGGGVESMLLGNMGLRIEALRYQWLDQGYTIGGMDTGKLGSHDTVVRAGLVFKLN